MKHHQASSPPDPREQTERTNMVVRSDRREMGWAASGLLAVRHSALLMGVRSDITT